MPSDLSHLEYAEEDLFGDEDVGPSVPELNNVNTSVPIAISSPLAIATPAVRAAQPVNAVAGPGPSSSSSASLGRTTRYTADDRLLELRQLKRGVRTNAEESRSGGVRSLKDCCMAVIKANAVRIWDIGDLEYALIKPFIDDLHKEQLAEIEQNSPHIKRDTDWLWEVCMLEDYPLFHERCRERQGEPRTTGWRRMYRKAVEDAAERQAQAADRVAARYKQLEEEKASKRIVMMDRALPEKKKTSGWGRARSAGASPAAAPKPISAIAKARVDAQRARVALTHASGRYVPPPPPRHTQAEVRESLFKNPYLPSHSSSSSLNRSGVGVGVDIVRLPPPRTALARSALASASATASSTTRSPSTARPAHSSSAPSSPIPGSYPTSQAAAVRAALPAHLSSRATSSPTTSPIKEIAKATQYKTVKKRDVPNFQIPSLPSEKKGNTVDYFAPVSADGGQAGRTTFSSPSARSAAQAPDGSTLSAGKIGQKRKAEDVEREKGEHIDPTGPDRATPRVGPTTTAKTVAAAAAPSSELSSADSAKLSSILFRKKAKVKGR